jgi:hypothetical protein
VLVQKYTKVFYSQFVNLYKNSGYIFFFLLTIKFERLEIGVAQWDFDTVIAATRFLSKVGVR